MKKSFLIPIIFILITLSAFSYEWPQDEITAETFNSYFGQNRGDILSTSIVFNNTEDIKASENGRVLIIMTDINDDSDFFPTSLGSSIVIAHQDKLASVYGNLNKDSITINESDNNIVEKGSTIASLGNSGWQNQQSGLEFQIIDLKNDSAINPKVLVSRIEKELPLTITGVYLNNKNGDYFDLNNSKAFSAGLYKVYRQRNPISNPYKTTVLVNGIQLDQINFDTLVNENNLVCVNGKRKYTSAEIYPNDKLQLIGEVMLSPGKSTLELLVSDFLNNTRRVTYNVSIY